MGAHNLAELCLDLAMHLNDCRDTAEWVKHCRHWREHLVSSPALGLSFSRLRRVCVLKCVCMGGGVTERNILQTIFLNHLIWKMAFQSASVRNFCLSANNVTVLLWPLLVCATFVLVTCVPGVIRSKLPVCKKIAWRLIWIIIGGGVTICYKSLFVLLRSIYNFKPFSHVISLLGIQAASTVSKVPVFKPLKASMQYFFF